jgi:prepilin-type N-terminal cleavage/methylation domain-containing protein
MTPHSDHRVPVVAQRRGFSLVELLVVISIVLMLMALLGGALSAARGSQKKQATQALIGKLNAIIQQQFASYGGRDVQAATPAARAVELRRIATGDLPDRWVDVKFMADNADQFTSPHQRASIAVWNSFPAISRDPTSDSFLGTQYAGAECLFMIVMRGGIANCLDCSDLANDRIGDKDGDGAFEFWDEWDNPIGYILWPGDLQLPAGSGTKFFDTSVPFAPGATARSLRPLIYSAGSDGEYGFERNGDTGNFTADASACGNPTVPPTSNAAAPLAGASDNITNFDAEAKP